jgi:hypothetical protein
MDNIVRNAAAHDGKDRDMVEPSFKQLYRSTLYTASACKTGRTANGRDRYPSPRWTNPKRSTMVENPDPEAGCRSPGSSRCR